MLNAWLAFRALPWRMIGLAALAFAVLSLFAHDRMVVAQNAKLKAQIAKLVEQSKQKQIEVREVIKEGKDRIVTVEKQAQRIEHAPLPGGCKTPPEILGADL